MPLVQAVRIVPGWTPPDSKKANTITCPNGVITRNTAVAIARAMMTSPRGGFPSIEFLQSPNPPIKAMSNEDVLKWVAETLKDEPNLKPLMHNLKKYNVDGEVLLSICRIQKDRGGRLSC